MVCDGGGMFATEDQYLVVLGTGYEIIDRIGCLTLSQTSAVFWPIVRPNLNRRVPHYDSFFSF